ncbi:uncharacterized protein BJX67DRAFT_356692 [Aspergillus lucknowensis]|uniref:Uncharacterized protein n=1 Tax=Aspergillus lucknowensis TaxID=176173 RepID=A0ABR4LRZ4_9EURO
MAWTLQVFATIIATNIAFTSADPSDVYFTFYSDNKCSGLSITCSAGNSGDVGPAACGGPGPFGSVKMTGLGSADAYFVIPGVDPSDCYGDMSFSGDPPFYAGDENVGCKDLTTTGFDYSNGACALWVCNQCV